MPPAIFPSVECCAGILPSLPRPWGCAAESFRLLPRWETCAESLPLAIVRTGWQEKCYKMAGGIASVRVFRAA